MRLTGPEMRSCPSVRAVAIASWPLQKRSANAVVVNVIVMVGCGHGCGAPGAVGRESAAPKSATSDASASLCLMAKVIETSCSALSSCWF